VIFFIRSSFDQPFIQDIFIWSKPRAL